MGQIIKRGEKSNEIQHMQVSITMHHPWEAYILHSVTNPRIDIQFVI